MPVFAAKAGGFFFIIFGVIVLIASLVHDQPDLELRPVRPLPRLGRHPARLVHRLRRRRAAPRPAGLGVRALRLHAVAEHPRPARSCSACSSSLVAIYPFIEAWITGDKREHHIADRPRNAPTRTAIGAAGVTFYAVLWAAASSDLIATHFRLTMEGVIHTLQALLFLGPIIAYFVTKRICIAPAEEGPRDRAARLRVRPHRPPARRRVHRGARAARREYERWKLVGFDDYKPLMMRPDTRGQDHRGRPALRAVLSRWFFEDRIAPVTQGPRSRRQSHHDAPLAATSRSAGGCSELPSVSDARRAASAAASGTIRSRARAFALRRAQSPSCLAGRRMRTPRCLRRRSARSMQLLTSAPRDHSCATKLGRRRPRTSYGPISVPQARCDPRVARRSSGPADRSTRAPGSSADVAALAPSTRTGRCLLRRIAACTRRSRGSRVGRRSRRRDGWRR